MNDEQRRARQLNKTVLHAVLLSWTLLVGCSAEPITPLKAVLRVAPTQLVFGPIPAGARQMQQLAIVNDGTAPYAPDAPITLWADAAAGFTVLDGCVLPLAPNALCNMTVLFAPGSAGIFSGEVRVPAVAGSADALVRVGLRATASEAQVLVSPSAIDFGAIDVGTTARDRIVVENASATEVVVPYAARGEGFLAAGQREGSLSIAAHASAELSIAFVPGRGGAFDASIVFEVCGADCGPRTTLTGSGLAPRIDVQPQTAAFGSVALGATGVVMLTVTNVGAGALVAAPPVVVGAERRGEVQVSGDVVTLQAGEATTVEVRYTPVVASAAVGGAVQFDSNDPLSPRVLVPLLGESPGPAIELLPGAIHFGVLDAGDSRTATVILRSTGTVPALVSGLQLTGASFDWVALPAAGPLLPGETWSFAITATGSAAAAAVGGDNGAVIVHTDGLSDKSTALTYTSGVVGCQPRAADPNAAFGSAALSSAHVQSVQVDNVGTSACVLARAQVADGFAFDSGFSYTATRAERIEPGAHGAVDFAWTVDQDGPVSAVVLLDYTAPDVGAPSRALFVSASGFGAFGDLRANPDALALGPVQAGCSAAVRTATFENVGAGPLDVDSVRLVSGAPQFTLGATGAVTLAPGGALSVEVSAASETPGTFDETVRATTTDALSADVHVTVVVTAPNAPVTESFIVAAASRVDVLFVVDNSGSMQDDQAILAANFESFIAGAFSQDDGPSDFHLGITTTDVLFGLGGSLVGPFFTQNTGALSSQFAAQAEVGIDGSGLELGLEAMRRVLDGGNGGFLRANAALSVIIVSDEDDSALTPEVAAVDPSVVRSVQSYVEGLRALKGAALANTTIAVNLVVAPGSPRYEAVAAAFDGVTLDITDATWGAALDVVGQQTFGLQRRFLLSADAVAGSVAVRVAGVATAFTVQGRAVTLTQTATPGAVVEISYVPDCQP